jgi:hypothetical protein
MLDNVSAFNWEITFISPDEYLGELNWTAEYEGLVDDTFGLVWDKDPIPESPTKGKLKKKVLANRRAEQLRTRTHAPGL